MSTQGISIKLKPSKLLIIFFLFLSIASMTVIGSLTVNMGLKIILSVVVIFYGGYILYQYGFLMSKYSIKQLILNPEVCLLRTEAGEFSAKLCGDSTITTKLCILRFKVANQWLKRSCLITQDALEQGSYRQLTITLRNMKW